MFKFLLNGSNKNSNIKCRIEIMNMNNENDKGFQYEHSRIFTLNSRMYLEIPYLVNALTD